MRGFSLIETLVAVVILVSAIVGPLTLAQRSIRSAVYARDQVTASFLAEEAIEYIRMMRDGNELRRRSNWLFGLSGDCLEQLCQINTIEDRDDAVSQCSRREGPLYGSFCEPLAFQTETGKYGYKPQNSNDWEDTKFVREVRIDTIPNGDRTSDDEAKVEVKVLWKTGDLPLRTVTVREYIYDW